MKPSIRLIAFYLPQFYPIPENDLWWGKGFTEWRNVVKAKPLFKSHFQPHLPADLGFYDLRTLETRVEQIRLAKKHGIHGFCYYHYWFEGRRLLNRPVDDLLKTKELDFPFCLCWANENWTRSWDGENKSILLHQNYSKTDDLNHIRWLSEIFTDNRYIRINGKPIFLVYRAARIPEPYKTTEIWRKEALRLGVGEIFLCRVESFESEHSSPNALGFDGAVEFQPDWSNLGYKLKVSSFFERIRSKLTGKNTIPAVYNYDDVVKRMMNKLQPKYLRFPCVTPGWDNTARRGNNALVIHNSTPRVYQDWLIWAIEKFKSSNKDNNIVFINAWNEWAEGCHLEPCIRWGDAFLKATVNALELSGQKQY